MVIALVVLSAVLVVVTAFEVGDTMRYRRRTGRLLWTRGPAPTPRPGNRIIPVAEEGLVQLRLNPWYGFHPAPGMRLSRQPNRDIYARNFGQRFVDTMWDRLAVNQAGFWAVDEYPVASQRPVVAVVGGSVAMQFAMTMEETLSAELGLPILLLNIANEGVKQPQQLTTLAYMAAIGQRIDAVINIDGFNEAFASWMHVNVFKTRPIAPWAVFIRGVQMVAIRGAAARRTMVARDAYLAAIERHDASRSALSRRLRAFGVHRLRRRFESTDADLGALTEAEVAELPMPLPPPGETEWLEPCVTEWLNASIALHRLAGGRYLHVLQPNQYHRNEAFTAAERAAVIDPDYFPPLSEIIPAAYDAMLARAPALAAAGVAFLDGTGAFGGRAYYNDKACHYFFEGNVLLARQIAGRLRPMLETAEVAPATPATRIA